MNESVSVLRVAVLMGGPSAEHAISVESGRAMVGALRERAGVRAVGVIVERDGRWSLPGLRAPVDPAEALGWLRRAADVALPVLHGPFGEDGTLQGALETVGIPYAGSGVEASALAMHKPAARAVLGAAGLSVPRGAEVRRSDFTRDEDGVVNRIAQTLGWPVFVKPARQGSSVGAGPASDAASLRERLASALAHDDVATVEERLTGEEITAAVLDERPGGPVQVLPLIAIDPGGRPFFDFEAKYNSAATREVCPAPIPADLADAVARAARRAHDALGCRGLTRADFIAVPGRGPILLEVNTAPGLTPASLVPKAAAAAGISLGELAERLVRAALRTHR